MNTQSRHNMAVRNQQLDALRQQIGQVEGPGRSAGRGVLPFDVSAMDSALPEGGLPLSCVHEVQGPCGDGAAPGFCAALLARLSQMKSSSDAAPVLWLEAGQGLYLPGLARYGLQPGQVFVVSNIRKSADRLWVLEEALRCGALAGVVAELDDADFTASRRLQLAAEAGGTTGLVLTEQHREGQNGMASAVTRWQVGTMPSMECRLNSGPPGVGDPCWDVALTHSRGGRADHWALEWQNETWNMLPADAANDAPVLLPVAANDDGAQVSSQVIG
jgi:protein ImuA